MLKQLVKNPAVAQFIAYFFVGGAAALVEWSTFAILDRIFYLHYVPAVVVSFVIATYTNLILGKKFVFKNTAQKPAREVVFVYLVSLAGLGINLLCMYVFVDQMDIDSLVSKVASTGIAFAWNFLSRKYFVYRQTSSSL